ncbi:hypothetical protein V1478_001672 [Vespula squamosa]|uniref:Uncharacterized protein n=1 Tax=Vespula squamosa TaxID=30214 RepID=A0ABD2BXS7_VESSQ
MEALPFWNFRAKIVADIVQGCLPGWKEKDIPYSYGSKLRTKLDEIHKITRERMKIKSNENKAIEKFSKNKGMINALE